MHCGPSIGDRHYLIWLSKDIWSVSSLLKMRINFQAAKERRKHLEAEQLALLEGKKKRGEEVRDRKTSGEETSDSNIVINDLQEK